MKTDSCIFSFASATCFARLTFLFPASLLREHFIPENKSYALAVARASALENTEVVLSPLFTS